MARLARLTVCGYPHHVIQRGNNRQSIFIVQDDYETWLSILGDYARATAVAVHAYVLMPNHFHLLATPSAPQALSGLMQAVGRRYVRYFNARHGRSGTLWEGRYRSTVIQAERHLLPCMVYMDLNPVRAGIALNAIEYPWSSHAHYCGRAPAGLVAPHPQYWSLGNTPFSREAAYAELVRAGMPSEQQLALTESALHGWALGDTAFMAELQKQAGRRISRSQPGRPPSVRPDAQITLPERK